MLRSKPVPVVSSLGAAIFGIVIALGAALLVIPIFPESEDLVVGNIVKRDLVSQYDISYVSDKLTEAEEEKAAAAIEPATLPLPSVKETQLFKLNTLLAGISAVRQRSDLTIEEKIAALEDVPEIDNISDDTRLLLVSLDLKAYESLENLSTTAVKAILSIPVLEEEIEEKIDSYIEAPGRIPMFQNGYSVMQELLIHYVEPNLLIDEEATELLRMEARSNVAPQIRTFTTGQLVAKKGTVLDSESIEALQRTGVIDRSFNAYDIAAGLIFSLGLGALLGGYVYSLQPITRPWRRRLAMITITILGTLLAMRLALPALLPDDGQQALPYALPLSAVTISVAAIGAPRFAAIVAIGIGLFAGFIGATSSNLAGTEFLGTLDALKLAMVYIAGGLAGAIMSERTSNLSQFLLAGLTVGITTMLVLLGFWLLEEPRTTQTILWILLASTLNGIGSAIIALGIHILIPFMLRVTTRVQLMELTSMNHPLLRRLQEEAPGTYHHSTIVASIAERAADQIGADSLMVRVGAYYHDIGKLTQPEYFIENNISRENSPHDELPAEESAAIIRGHVIGGIELARRYRLPDVIRDFIPQHHGTRLITYFYHKAAGEGTLDQAPFRYPGPLPQLAEHAIVMLADSCEATVRANQPLSNEQIETIVEQIFTERISEGQLDECDLSMNQLRKVADSFKSSLQAVHHPRIEYPESRREELQKSADA
ncbi:MAG: HDIG domain-containing protein [Dehalococcoidia bacterium]|nr:HDIG domain-containing protein [Dehalococcoidia bacterium]